MYCPDFCIFAPATPNSTISDTEGEEVTWCTQPGHGTRIIPPGTFTGLQVLNNSNYIQYVGFVNQANINIYPGDYGGELDPHGQDLVRCVQRALESCPLIVCPKERKSDRWSDVLDCVQHRWHYYRANPRLEHVRLLINLSVSDIHRALRFVGGNVTALKICDPAGPNPGGYCQNTLDRIGMAYNMPNNAQNGVFEVCDSDPMDVPGIYTSGGQTLSYSQPAESLGPITTIPYTPRIPASSNCQTFQSSDLFKFTPSGLPTSTASTPTPSSGGNVKTGSSGTRTGTSSPASSTSGSNGAGVVTISLFSSILGVAFSVAFLA